MAIPPQFMKHQAGKGKPTPAGPGGKFDPADSPGKDENGDGVYGKPSPSKKGSKPSPKGNPALEALKAAKPKGKMGSDGDEPC